jgi:5'-nucleotidase
MTRKILYIDLDGVIVDYQSGFKNFVDKRSKGFFEYMLPIDGALEAVKKLAEYYDVYFLSTAPWSNPHSWSEKRLWVEKHLGEIAFKKLILTHNKGLLKGDFLIDDTRKNGVLEFEGEFIQFGTEKFRDWNAIIEYLV